MARAADDLADGLVGTVCIAVLVIAVVLYFKFQSIDPAQLFSQLWQSITGLGQTAGNWFGNNVVASEGSGGPLTWGSTGQAAGPANIVTGTVWNGSDDTDMENAQ